MSDVYGERAVNLNEEKLQRALDYLGQKWVLHKNYKYDPKHNQNGWCHHSIKQSK